ncbi:MAG: metallophosphoesterase [Spirochaetes bacterium GWF1_51_8]|nr:MAG: metallophosphoesterase [Spirochaetes bacterium GWF1_51_8]
MKSSNVFRVAAFGDIIGDPGRKAFIACLRAFREKWQPDTLIVNGENAAHGFGITRTNVEEFFQYGVEAITSGNHVWQKKETFEFIDKYPGFLRPINFPENTPGHGSVVINSPTGVRFAVISAMGRIYMEPIECPFHTVEREIEQLKKEGVKIILVDFHAEATSEKQMFGRYLDGKASAIWGTHTHIQTADETILPNKTAYITDIGMCGCQESIIGMKIADSYRKIVQHLPVRFSPEENGPTFVNGIIVDIDKTTGQAVFISRFKEVFGAGPGK